MRNILNPRWLILVNTIPLAILFGMYVGIYQIISTLLAEENRTVWWEMGMVLAVLWAINWGYTLYLSFKKREIQLWYAIFALFAYTIFFLQYAENERMLIPWNVPRWMLPNTMWDYVGTFLMPLLFHALMVIVVRLTSSYSNSLAIKNLAAALAMPLGWYMFMMVVAPILRGVAYNKIAEHVFIIFSVTLAALFLFLLCRAIYIFSMAYWEKSRQRDSSIGKPKFNLLIFLESNEFGLKLLLGIFAPILGLALNQSLDNFFGNFSHWSFYAIAVANGTFLCLPALQTPLYRLIILVLRSITFSFIFYFFLVFLPILPLSMVLLLAIVGALTLTPLILFFIQVQQIWADMQFLYTHYNRLVVNTLLIVGLLVLPLSLHFSYLEDKEDLHEALDYVYAPNLTKEASKIDVNRLKTVFYAIQRNKSNNSWGLSNRQSPFLSLYYNWLVLDNLTLSTEKIERLSKIFIGKEDDYGYYNDWGWRGWRQTNTLFPDSVKISKATVSSTFDKEKKFWTSWIDLEITNLDTTTTGFDNQSEYRTKFELSDGAWISDYYLWIEKEKVHGLLAEKKTAMWVYNQIVATRRDPGLLHYTEGNEVSFRVFPFLPSETRKTGIQLIHKEPISFKIDSLTLFLGDTTNNFAVTQPIESPNKQAIYIPKGLKKQLAKVKRETYPHFVINCAKDKRDNQAEYKNIIQQFIATHSLSKENVKITFANAYTQTIDFVENWQSKQEHIDFGGGFYLERAIEEILYKNRNSTKIPQIVVVTDSISEVILEKGFGNYKVFYPENQVFLLLSKRKGLSAYRLDNLTETKVDDFALEAQTVLEWQNGAGQRYYLPDNEQASVVWNEKVAQESSDIPLAKKDWESGLYLQGKWLNHTFASESSDKEWLSLVKDSFKAQIMSPVTSFISLENEAQRQALLRKQEDVLNAKKSLDISEDVQRMSESNYVFWVGIFVYLLIILVSSILALVRKSSS
jgi:hypothetical protein